MPLKRSVVLFAALLLPLVQPLFAQQFPSKPVRFVVPFPPGGSTDVLARLLGQKLSERWGQSIVVENRPGANTLIGAELVAHAAPDGYTWFMPIDSTFTMNPALYPKLPYDLKDFAPVTILTQQSLLIAANPRLPAKTLKDVVQYAKANPGKVNYATGAITSQITGEVLKQMAGIDIVNVRYAGSAPTHQAVLAGNVELAIGDIGPYIPDLKAGKLNAIATTGGRRAQALPDVPTIAEQGYPEFEQRFWYGLMVTAGTPPAVVEKIRRDVTEVLKLPEVSQRAATFALEVSPNTPEEFLALIRSQRDRWTKVIKSAGIKIE